MCLMAALYFRQIGAKKNDKRGKIQRDIRNRNRLRILQSLSLQPLQLQILGSVQCWRSTLCQLVGLGIYWAVGGNAMKLYNYAMKLLNIAIPEFKKEGMTDKDIQEGFDVAKRILNRLVLKKGEKEALEKALEDAKKSESEDKS